MLLHQNIVCQNKFFNFCPNFLYYFLLIWLFQEQFHIRLYLQKCKLVVVNTEIKFCNNAFEAAEFWCIVDLTAVLCLLHKGKTLLFFNLELLLLLSERDLSPESCLASCVLRASCL